MATTGDGSGVFLMERTWEKIQQKTFTKWVNSHLRKRKLAIEDLQKDFGDGVRLYEFLEIISGDKLGRIEKKPRIRIQKIQNVSVCLEFLKSQKIQLVNISAEDITDENLKLILGLIWTIIQKFQIEDISEEALSAKEALLLWCQKKTAGYKDVKVDNFTWSFQDGLALCALIHRHRPDLLDISKLKKENKAENLQLAFDVADRELGIPKLLDVEDMVDIKPDERSVITYVSQYYHVFSKYNQAEVAGRRVGKLVDLTATLEGMKNDYGDKARKLVDWINRSTTQIQDRNFDNTLDGIKQKIDDFKQYKAEEKPPKAADKATVEVLFNNINLKLRSNNRPLFDPPANMSPTDIEHLWDTLGNEEVLREKALLEELRRQEKLAVLRARFDLKAGKVDGWLTAKEDYLNAEEAVNSLNEAQTKLKNHEAFDEEYANSKPRIDAVQEIVSQIAALSPTEANEYQTKADSLANRWSGLAGPQAKKRTDLEEKLAKEQKKEELRLEFAKQAKEYNVWVKHANNQVNDHNFGDSLDAVVTFQTNLDSTESDITNGSNSKKQALDDLWDQLTALGVTENQYTPITNKDIASTHDNLLAELQKRRAAYDQELIRQKNMEEKRKEFAQKAQEFVDSLNQRKSSVEAAAKTGEVDDAVRAVKDTYAEGSPEASGLQSLSSLQEEMAGLGIRENKHTNYNLPILQAKNTQFANNVRNIISALNDEKELKDEYNQKAQELVDWVNQTLPKLKERNFDNTLEGARAQHNEWQKYLTTEKGKKEIDHLNLQSLFSKIGAVVSGINRPNFTPASPLDPASIQALWDQLNADEKEKEASVTAELTRQEKLATLVKRFHSDAEDLESWTKEKDTYLKTKEDVHDLDTARMKVKFLEVFNSEFANKRPALSALKGLADEIAGLNYHDVNSVQATQQKLEDTFSKFEQLAESKNHDLRAALQTQQGIEDKRVEFANLARDFNRYVRDAIENIDYYNFGYSLEDVTAYQNELDSSDNEYQSKADQLKADIDRISSDLSSAGVTDNRHTKLTQSDIENIRKHLSDSLQKRRTAYSSEHASQSQNEEIRKRFAEKANGFIDWVEQQRVSLEKLEGEPEQRIGSVQSIYQDGVPSNTQVDEIKAIDAEAKAHNIYDNKYTPYSLPIIITRQNQFDTSIKNFIQDLTEEKEFNERSAALRAEYERKQKLENQKIGYGKDADALHFWLKDSSVTLNDPIKCETVADVDALQKELEHVRDQKPDQSTKYESLVQLASELQSVGITDFGKHPIDSLTKSWQEFLHELDTRESALHQERIRQEENEKIRVEFANTAKALKSFITENFQFVNNLPGDLEQQLAALQSRRHTIHSGQDQVNQVEQLAKQLDNAGVTENPHTDLSVPTLKVDYEELVKTVSAKEGLLQKEIIGKKGSSVSAEQLAEFKEVFEHFDKDRTGNLNKLNFKSCLQSLDFDYPDNEIDSIISNIGSNGQVSFEAFYNFMGKKAADSETKEQILEAFKVLSGNKDFITEDDMRRALPAEKVDYLKQHMPLHKGSAGNYDYVAWATSSFQG